MTLMQVIYMIKLTQQWCWKKCRSTSSTFNAMYASSIARRLNMKSARRKSAWSKSKCFEENYAAIITCKINKSKETLTGLLCSPSLIFNSDLIPFHSSHSRKITNGCEIHLTIWFDSKYLPNYCFILMKPL